MTRQCKETKQTPVVANNTGYIDKKALLDEFEKWNFGKHGQLEKYFADRAFAIIDKVPTADVVEVRHGRWIEDAEAGCLICSECGRYTDEIIGDFIEADEDLSRALEIPLKTKIHRSMNPFYCSKCGAKMDGKGDKDGNQMQNL